MVQESEEEQAALSLLEGIEEAGAEQDEREEQRDLEEGEQVDFELPESGRDEEGVERDEIEIQDLTQAVAGRESGGEFRLTHPLVYQHTVIVVELFAGLATCIRQMRERYGDHMMGLFVDNRPADHAMWYLRAI